MIIYIILFVLLLIFLFFIWSNFTLIKNHIHLNEQLENSVVNLEKIKKQYSSHIYQLNKDILKVNQLENILINKELNILKNEKRGDKK